MARDRGQRSDDDSEQPRAPSAVRCAIVVLARGVTLLPGGAADSCVLVSPNGTVQLNDGAIAILRLCDGSRTAEEIAAEVMRASTGATLASDITEFLDAAQARGWIVSISR